MAKFRNMTTLAKAAASAVQVNTSVAGSMVAAKLDKEPHEVKNGGKYQESEVKSFDWKSRTGVKQTDPRVEQIRRISTSAVTQPQGKGYATVSGLEKTIVIPTLDRKETGVSTKEMVELVNKYFPLDIIESDHTKVSNLGDIYQGIFNAQTKGLIMSNIKDIGKFEEWCINNGIVIGKLDNPITDAMVVYNPHIRGKRQFLFSGVDLEKLYAGAQNLQELEKDKVGKHFVNKAKEGVVDLDQLSDWYQRSGTVQGKNLPENIATQEALELCAVMHKAILQSISR